MPLLFLGTPRICKSHSRAKSPILNHPQKRQVQMFTVLVITSIENIALHYFTSQAAAQAFATTVTVQTQIYPGRLSESEAISEYLW